MGNSSSTIQTYENEIEEGMKSRIKASANKNFSTTLNDKNVLPHVAEMTDSGAGFAGIEAKAGDSIDTFMSLLALARFPVDFGYQFRGKPQGAVSEPVVSSGLCSISTPIGSQVEDFLRSGIFSGLGIPIWVERQATSDLVDITSNLVTDSPEPTWNSKSLSQTYDSAVGDQGDWKVNVLVLCVQGALTIDGLRAGYAIVYYLASFYGIQSDSKFLRNALQRDAYVAADKLVPQSVIGNDTDLSNTLKKNGNNVFQNQFHFPYGSTPPESWQAEGVSSAYLKSNTQLLYLPILNPGRNYLGTSIEQGLFSGLDVPVAPIKRDAIADMTTDFASVLKGTPQNLWNIHELDRLYTPTNPALNPIRQKSVLSSWYKYWENYSTHAIVPVTYIFVQTMFYEELSAERKAIRRLFRILSDKIRQELQKPPAPDDDLISLQNMLYEYAGQKFQANFGFAYNGNQSNPPDKRPNGAVRGYSELLQATTHPSSVKDVEDWLNSEVFLRDSLTFPAFANNAIWEKIRDDVVECTKTTASDSWNTAHNSTVYLHPKGGTNIKQYSQYVYTIGELEVDGVKVTRVFVCYLGVYCGTAKTS